MIPDISIKEQKQVVKTLDHVSNLIYAYKQQLAKLDELVKARFVEMFGDPIHPKQSNKLGTIAKLERGRFSPRPRNDPRYYNGQYPFIQTGDIANSGHRLSNYTQTLNELGIGVSKRFEAGTIVIALVGATIGATAILERDVYAPDSVIGITPNYYNNVFLETLLQFWQPELLRNAPESARPNINLEILSNLPIVEVDQAQQMQFAWIIQQIDKSKLAVKQSLEKLEMLKKSLMQQYFE